MLSKLRDATNSTQEKDSATSLGGSFPAETKPHRGKSAIPGGIFCYSRKSIYLKGETQCACLQAEMVMGGGGAFGGSLR